MIGSEYHAVLLTPRQPVAPKSVRQSQWFPTRVELAKFLSKWGVRWMSSTRSCSFKRTGSFSAAAFHSGRNMWRMQTLSAVAGQWMVMTQDPSYSSSMQGHTNPSAPMLGTKTLSRNCRGCQVTGVSSVVDVLLFKAGSTLVA